jgi:hypothetical protein
MTAASLSDLAGASEVKYAEVQHHSARDGAARARVGASGVAHVRDQATGYRSGGIDDQLTVVIPKHYLPRAKGQYRRGKAWIEASREAQGHR